jgi:hypothetical protein
MSALSGAERVRRHRARARAARAATWITEYPAAYGPFLEAWAGRGLRLPPTPAQLQLLTPYAERERGPQLLGHTLRRIRRARARHSPTTYRLVAALIRALEAIRSLATDARSAFDRPLDLSDPRARRERGEGEPAAERPPPRSSRKRSDGQTEADGQLTFRERMELAGLDPALLERFGRRDDE